MSSHGPRSTRFPCYAIHRSEEVSSLANGANLKTSRMASFKNTYLDSKERRFTKISSSLIVSMSYPRREG